MKNTLLLIITVVALLAFPKVNFAQAPNLGTTVNFELFTSVGAVTNTGISQVTGDVGSNTSNPSGFGNVNGVMESINLITAQAVVDLNAAYLQLNADIPAFFPAPLLGNGQILVPGVYSISSPATLNLGLTLDGQGNANSVFVIQINGSFSTNALSKVYLINQAQACNVFWKVEGAVSMAAGTSMKGTIVANNAAIDMGTGDTLEGRALSTSGLVSINGVLAYTPIGCGSPVLTGPAAPALNSTACYTIFSSDGPVTNTGVTHVVGDIGTNLGSTTGYNPLFVAGMIHPIPDPSTAQCATDLTTVYNYLNLLGYDIELLYPAQLGNGLVLTPHTYIMKAAAVLTDTLYLNAQNDASAVFVIQIEGALTESGTGAKVKLINGTLAQNVFWLINGSVTLNNFSVFEGTIVSTSAIILNFGDTLHGRALTTVGAITTAAIEAIMPPGCANNPPNITLQPNNQTVCAGDSVSFVVTASGAGLTYQWRKGNVNVVNGGNISGATTDTLTFNPANIGDAALNYNVIIIGTFPPSDTSINVSLTVNPLPVANAGPDKGICIGDSVTIGTTAIIGNTYSWMPILGLNSTTIAQPNASPAINTTYIVTVTNTLTGCKNTDTVNVTLNPPPVALVGLNKSICKGDSASIGVPPVIGLTYKWLPTLGLNSSVISQPNASPAITTRYTLTVTNGTCTDTASVTVTILSLPVATAGPDRHICTINGTILGAPGILGNTYDWSPATGLNSTLIAQPTATPTITTTYTVTVTNGVCSNIDSVRVIVDPSPLANAGTDQIICDGMSAQLGGTAIVGNTYMWSPGTGLNSTTIAQPEATPPTTTLYTLVETDTATGCSASNQVLVTIEPNNFYNGFSPNGDGVNDFWDIPMLNCYPTNSVIINNRWGSEVWTGTNYNNIDVKWTGQNAYGQDLPDGTYYYIISYNNTQKRGWVFIKR